MNPYRAHDHVWISIGAVWEGLGDSPGMMREDRGPIGNVGGEEKGNRIDENRSNGGGDEESRDNVSSGITTVAREGAAERM